MKKEDNSRIDVTDMYLAAALSAYGAKIESIDDADSSRKVFWFSGNVISILVETDDGVQPVSQPTLQDVRLHFWAGRLWFPPGYSAAIRNIKTAIHSR